MTTPTKKIAPHHLLLDGKPICGVKGKALVAWTAATPADHACGRCRRAAESRKIALPSMDIPRAEIENPLMPVVTPALEAVIAKEGHTTPTAEPQRVEVLSVSVGEHTGKTVEEALAKAKKARKPAAEKKPRTPKADVPKFVKIPTFLLDPDYTFTESGKVDTITGTCLECKTNRRTIHAADAFQVRRCEACQKKAVAKRVSDRRKAKRVAAKKAAAKE